MLRVMLTVVLRRRKRFLAMDTLKTMLERCMAKSLTAQLQSFVDDELAQVAATPSKGNLGGKASLTSRGCAANV